MIICSLKQKHGMIIFLEGIVNSLIGPPLGSSVLFLVSGDDQIALGGQNGGGHI
jgi:hypothetical protein